MTGMSVVGDLFGSGTKRIAGKRNPTEKQRSGVAGSSFQKNIVLS
jgi:hypothetical protein